MRGRTNVGGGGLEINGDIEQWLIKDGEIIQEGDFVQIETRTMPTSITPSLSSTQKLFNLSDGRQITFYGDTPIKFIVDDFNNSSVSPVEVSTNKYSQNGYWEVCNVDADKFVILTDEETYVTYQGDRYYSTTYQVYLMEYDVANDTFNLTQTDPIGSIAGWYVASSITLARPSIFEVVKINSQYFGIICTIKDGLYDDTAYFGFILYDYINGNSVQRLKSSRIITQGSFLRGNRVLKRKLNSTLYNFYYAVDVMSVVKIAVEPDATTPARVGATYTVQRQSPYLELEYIGYIAWNSIGYSFYSVLNNKVYSAYFNDSTNKIYISAEHTSRIPFTVVNVFSHKDRVYFVNSNGNVVNASSNFEEITESALYQNAHSYNQYHIDDLTSDIFATYSGTTRRTAEKGARNLVKISDVETIKKYVDKIDGVSDMDGVGGNTIKIYVPASS